VSTVVALGGNALMRPGERGTAAEQLANLRRAVEALRPLLGEPGLVITHGNGPQVGNELLRQERAADEAPPLPLWLAVAQTQAEIGALISAELGPALEGRQPACVLTHVRVAADDPAFDRPTKPIGPFYSAEEAARLERERGWAMVSDANRGHRRVVPSPEPLEIVELEVIRRLVEGGTAVIACGGGGIPVVRRGDRLAGVDAVIEVGDEAGDGALEVDVVFPEGVVGVDEQGLIGGAAEGMVRGLIGGLIWGGHLLIIRWFRLAFVTKVRRVCNGWGI